MKRHVLIAATTAAVLSTAAMLPGSAGAMTITAPAGLSNAAADLNPVENVWCTWRGCWGGGYWGPRPYWGYGYYRPYGIYGGWGWRRRW